MFRRVGDRTAALYKLLLEKQSTTNKGLEIEPTLNLRISRPEVYDRLHYSASFL